jgi:hypothetical protein
LKVAFSLVDDAMPRTVYWQQFREAVERNPRYTPNEAEADLFIPAEDTALETNWPRYGKPESAYVRGRLHEPTILNYLNRIATARGPFCVVSMYPSMRLAWAFSQTQHVLVADVSMQGWERSLNPRTISMPALPITAPGEIEGPHKRDILASFRGAPSHPCRKQLAALHNGREFVVELLPVEHHAGKIDAMTRTHDTGYVELMRRSVFAFVPRGDCHFSYRLIETLAYGCIPIVLSDGWVLPFDRLVNWASASLHVQELLIPAMGDLLGKFTPQRVAEMQAEGAKLFQTHLASMDRVVDTLLLEIERTFHCVKPAGK